MNAVPKKFLGGELSIIPAVDIDGEEYGKRTRKPTGGVWLECTIVQPASSVGRTVNVYFDPEAVTKMLLELRTVAIAARSQTLPKEV